MKTLKRSQNLDNARAEAIRGMILPALWRSDTKRSSRMKQSDPRPDDPQFDEHMNKYVLGAELLLLQLAEAVA